ncbi:ATP-binding protein [Mycobacterium frederiksbergense]|uniref:ATP-binding protein n=1 Tax=Mycolicibacterium frederiksbergense TaxID=117567 RepID=UPI0021F336E8|nr:ATP-binding protein [Mycolicibacterium frederiksbergense]MCV7046747.1 ATP-binding protein [Mycolicibacterium frederiksbergense]
MTYDLPNAHADSAGAVGQVVGTEDATPLVFHVALYPDAYLQLDDVVATSREVPGRGTVTTSGIVTDVRSRHEGATFGSDVFLVSEGVLPARVQEIAEVTTTRVEPELYVPPRPGAVARRATGTERSEALYFDQMQRRLPVGAGRDGETVFVDLDFIDGNRGAHISISGISGVATKTSFALFLLHALFNGGVLAHAHNAKALVFSVKGEDLLFLDKPNTRLSGDDGDDLRDSYARLGLPAAPFKSVGFFAPPTPGDNNARPNVTGRTDGVHAFWWTIDEFCADGLLPYVFADAEDERNQYTLVVHQVTAKLRREATPAGSDGAVTVDGVHCRTYAELVDFIVDRVTDPATMADWAGPAIGAGTANAFVRRLRSSQRALTELIRGDIPERTTRQITTANQQVTVVDLHNLMERAQRFVTGVVLAAETARKEAAGPGSLLFTMLDELNKYAPREGSSPIKEVLLDIAERGRSLGIILIGAQQTASEVERRIISNSAIKVVGRLDSAEASRPEYGFLPSGQRLRATIAKPGTMFVSQPAIPVPLAVEFPFPAWATRLSEVGTGPTSPSGHGAFPSGIPQPDDAPPF